MQPLPDDEFLAAQRRRDPVTTSHETKMALAAVLGLVADERTRGEPIRVSVQNDVVLLAGVVHSWQTRATAADVVRAVPGTHDVCNGLVVSGPSSEDEFDRIVAGWQSGGRRRWRAGPLTFSLLLLLWLALPMATVVLRVPAVPALIAAFVGTAAVLSARFLKRRPAAEWRHGP
ncbi:BON domain-containing protein [Actinoplanes sp. NPDC049596]|uniref:BON domain-containing protein n=1 Tax=unclassified Actinoplanes TaxID=2626549 RepID=UPI003432A6CB